MKNVLPRLSLIGLAIVIAGGVLYDPYTTSLASDTPFIPAPLLRTGVIILELVLLCTYVYFVIKERYIEALLTLAAASLINVGLNIALVLRHGLDRFVVVYGTAEILSTYLALVGVRIVALAATAFVGKMQKPPGSEPQSADAVT